MKGSVYSLPLQPEFVQEIIGKYTEFTEKNPDMTSSMVIFELKLLNDPYVMTIKATNWARDISATFDKWFDKSGREQRAGDHGTVLAYGNYDHYDSKGPDDLFGLNYPRLQELKAKFDPGNVFSKQFSVTSKA
ncbi:hypothetical protein diail_2037 [Diaporthe ilicicola]|nr:hypothetical protein diail_2037 [Diaporthe ilicicola]